MRRVSSFFLALSLLQSAVAAAVPLRVAPLPTLERPSPAFVASVACESQVDERLNTVITHILVRNTGVAVLAEGTPIQYDLGGGLVVTYPLETKLARGETANAFDRIGRYPTCDATILRRPALPPGGLIQPKPPVGIGLRCETSIQMEGPATQAFIVNDGAAEVPAGTRVRVTATGTDGTITQEIALSEALAPGQRRQVFIFAVEGRFERCKAEVL